MTRVGFKKLTGKLEAKGASAASAGAIAAAIGRKKYGKKRMKLAAKKKVPAFKARGAGVPAFKGKV